MLLVKKYITKELLLHFIAIIGLLFFISISNKFIGLLAKVASGKLPFFMVCKVMVLSSPEILGLLMPLSLFIATLFVVSKLYAENEIVVLFASGLSWSFLISTTIMIAILVAVVTSVLTLWASPLLIEAREIMLNKGQSIGVINSIIPGHFQVINDGKQVFYVGDVDNNKVNNIFIATMGGNNGSNLVITAKSGNIETLADQDSSFLILQNGRRYSGVVGSRNFSIIDFDEYGRELMPKTAEVSNLYRVKKTKDICNSKIPGEKAEYEWRLAMPISVIILAVLAVGLAKVAPRQGRFAKFLPAILLYIIYCNCMLFMRRLVATNAINEILGIWVVHLVFFILGILLLLQSSGWLAYVHKKFFTLK
jgi:lipopolysaccharide export system permease protein